LLDEVLRLNQLAHSCADPRGPKRFCSGGPDGIHTASGEICRFRKLLRSIRNGGPAGADAFSVLEMVPKFSGPNLHGFDICAHACSTHHSLVVLRS
jgi:hypothetical protein